MKPTTIRFEEELYAQLLSLTEQRDVTFSAILREAARQYVASEALKEEMAGMEDRLSASLSRMHRDMGRVDNDLQILIAIVDKFLQFALSATPEIMDKQSALAIGNERYAKFLTELGTALTDRGRKAKIVKDIEGDADVS